MGSKIDLTGSELIEIGKLMSDYGRLLQEAGESVSETSQEGPQTIHVGIKAARRLVQKLLGQRVLPDDSLVDAILLEKVVKSGISENYSVTHGRKMTPKELRVRAEADQFEKVAREAQQAKSKVEHTKAPPNPPIPTKPVKPPPKSSPKKKV
jgi:hypothetical protein